MNNKLGREKSANSPTKRKQQQSYNWVRVLGHREIVGFEQDEFGQPVINKLWHRTNIYNHVGGIYELKKPTQIDLWWAKDFLMKVAKHPVQGREKKIDIRMVSYNPSRYGMRKYKKTVPESFAAMLVLTELMDKWPQLKADQIEPVSHNNGQPTKKVKKLRKKTAILLTECALRGVNKKLVETRQQSKYWEIRLRNMSVSDSKLQDLIHKCQMIRKELLRLENSQQELEARLPVSK